MLRNQKTFYEEFLLRYFVGRPIPRSAMVPSRICSEFAGIYLVPGPLKADVYYVP